GSTVTIKDENGNIVGETTADDDGNFEVVVEGGGLADGEEYEVTATDKAGNETDPTTITGDTTAPAISDITVVQVDSDNPADGEADKTVVTFKGDDDTATYTATGPNGEEAVIEGPDAEGNYTATFEPALNADDEITIKGVDLAGNEATETGTVPSEITFEDTDAPIISDVVVTQVDSDNPADGEADKTVVTFKGDDDTATYTATGPNGEEAVIEGPDAEGNYNASSEPALNAGDQITIRGIDIAGNEATETGTVPSEITFEDTDAPVISDVPTKHSYDLNPADGEADKTVVTFKGDDDTATYTATGPNGEEAVIEGPD